MELLATDRHIAVVGLGSTGLSCVRHLTRRGRSFSVMDSRRTPPGLKELREINPDAPLHLGGFDKAMLDEADEIWLSPGVPLDHPDIRPYRDKPIRGDIDVFAREAKAPIVAITGSNGKSTVTTLVGEMAQAAGREVRVGGNLGIPALDLLDERADLYVLEVSSFQLETTYQLGAEVATILNLSQDHMDRYPDMLAYHRAKLRVFANCRHAVLNRDDMLAQPPMAEDLSHTWFTAREPGPGEYGLRQEGATTWICCGREALLDVSELRMAGMHNWLNALAALAIAARIQLPLADCLGVLRHFRGLAHRTEWLGQKHGVTYYNDSKATNVGATLAAIAGLQRASEGGLVLILGGQGKGQDFAPLFKALPGAVKHCILLGEDRALLKEGILSARVGCTEAGSMTEVVEAAAQQAAAGDAVLLSPACASLDMFQSYIDRGDQFKEAFEAL